MCVSRGQIHDDSVGVYIHVPFCESKCRYCAFYSEPVTGCDTNAMVQALLAEMRRCYENRVVTAYIGGGSPTALPAEELLTLASTVRQRWPGICEFTVECNPGQVNAGLLRELRKTGVNRLSFGVQSSHDYELRLLGRRHSFQQVERSINEAFCAGFENVGLDLIFAIPGSTLDKWKATLEAAVGTGVKHISAYALSIEPGTALWDDVEAGRICRVDGETDRRMYEVAIDYLAEAGFEQYEISNFARPGFECVHNQGYWENREYIGIGPSAGSYHDGVRSINLNDAAKYIETIAAGGDVRRETERADRQARICETAVLNLRRRKGIDAAAFLRRTGADFAAVFAGQLERYLQEGLVEYDGGRVRLSRKALGVADSVLCDFSAI